MKHVLCLASWYPSRVDHFAGDFVERHVLSISQFVKMTVIVVLKDDSLAANQVEIEKTTTGNLTVYRAYYGKTIFPIRIESILSMRKYFGIQKKICNQLISDVGKPDIVHVQIAMKAGVFALFLKSKYGLPYVVTENWTGYYPQSKPAIYQNNFLYRFLNRQVLKRAALFLPVTADLGETVCKYFTPLNYSVIPNVVNTGLFFYLPFETSTFRFIHPSTMNYQKNPEGILKACSLLKEKGYRFELFMVGNDDKELTDQAMSAGLLNEVVFFKPPIAYEMVATEMQQSDALLMFSRFENLPCIILEALCCGLPVVSSRVGGIHEVINEENGLLVESENIQDLADAMMRMIDNYRSYNRIAISAKAAKLFNYNSVGTQHINMYKRILEELSPAFISDLS